MDRRGRSAIQWVRALMPPPTIRLRLTLLYGVVFLITGAVLLTIGYALVRHNLGQPQDFRDELRRLHLPAPLRGRPPDFGPRSTFGRFGAAVRAAVREQALSRLVLEYLAALRGRGQGCGPRAGAEPARGRVRGRAGGHDHRFGGCRLAARRARAASAASHHGHGTARVGGEPR